VSVQKLPIPTGDRLEFGGVGIESGSDVSPCLSLGLEDLLEVQDSQASVFLSPHQLVGSAHDFGLVQFRDCCGTPGAETGPRDPY
jgi:hypothetical protein